MYSEFVVCKNGKWIFYKLSWENSIEARAVEIKRQNKKLSEKGKNNLHAVIEGYEPSDKKKRSVFYFSREA